MSEHDAAACGTCRFGRELRALHEFERVSRHRDRLGATRGRERDSMTTTTTEHVATLVAGKGFACKCGYEPSDPTIAPDAEVAEHVAIAAWEANVRAGDTTRQGKHR